MSIIKNIRRIVDVSELAELRGLGHSKNFAHASLGCFDSVVRDFAASSDMS